MVHSTHALPKCYQKLMPDLTLGPGIREITLVNNEGVILVETPDCSAPPAVEFSASGTKGVAPMSVYFTDLSSNVPTSWSWDFGDNSISFAQNPTHTYNNPGNYTVSLTVTNADGSDTETKVSYITVEEPGSGGGKGNIKIE